MNNLNLLNYKGRLLRKRTLLNNKTHFLSLAKILNSKVVRLQKRFF